MVLFRNLTEPSTKAELKPPGAWPPRGGEGLVSPERDVLGTCPENRLWPLNNGDRRREAVADLAQACRPRGVEQCPRAVQSLVDRLLASPFRLAGAKVDRRDQVALGDHSLGATRPNKPDTDTARASSRWDSIPMKTGANFDGSDVLGAETDADEPRGNPPQERPARRQTQRPGEREPLRAAEHSDRARGSGSGSATAG